MDQYEEYARRIPDEVRSQRLLTAADPIKNSVEITTDPNMQLLFTIWFEFIKPHADDEERDIGCWKCRQRIRYNFGMMYNTLLELEKEYQLLKCLTPH